MKTKLINPTGDTTGQKNAIDWEGCDYSKCGRTDRGVSAFGQVIGLRVRSNRPLSGENAAFDDNKDELGYVQILNSLLPSDIRVLAWCPNPPEDFSARFSCRSRHYKYFFTQPSFMPTPSSQGLRQSLTVDSVSNDKRREGWLDIQRMQDAAKRFEGLHDFRNFCKVDGSKQISDYRRRIFRSEIRALTSEEMPAAYVSGSLFRETNGASESSTHLASLQPDIYIFDLQGSAFLWHQVRHMVAVLFLVGQGLEAPAIVDDLLNVADCAEKPHYEMADETPLVLWNCTFPREGDDPLHDSLDWRYVGGVAPVAGQRASSSVKFGLGGAIDEIWSLWRAAKMDEVLRGTLLNLIASQPDLFTRDPSLDLGKMGQRKHSQKVFLGGNVPAYKGVYVPLLKRQRLRSVDEVNREYAEKHGLPDKMSGVAKGHPEESRGDHDE
jgi:tRNA pseudouridine38/39 synthase